MRSVTALLGVGVDVPGHTTFSRGRPGPTHVKCERLPAVIGTTAEGGSAAEHLTSAPAAIRPQAERDEQLLAL